IDAERRAPAPVRRTASRAFPGGDGDACGFGLQLYRGRVARSSRPTIADRSGTVTRVECKATFERSEGSCKELNSRFFASLRMTIRHERLGGFGGLRRFAHHRETFLGLFQTLWPSRGGHNQFFHIAEDVRVLHFFAQLLQEWFKLSEKDKHFTAEAGLQKELPIQGAMQYERSSHFPVSANLAKPVILLGAQRGCDFHDVVGGFRPKAEPPVARFSDFAFPAQVVEFHDEFSISSRWCARRRCARHCSLLSNVKDL